MLYKEYICIMRPGIFYLSQSLRQEQVQVISLLKTKAEVFVRNHITKTLPEGMRTS